jgi:type I restriction enzyme M protein
MVREALRERFLETLKKSGGSAGNSRLRSELGWQKDTYWTVHAALVEEGAVVAGRGRGGSVGKRNLWTAVFRMFQPTA